MTFTSHFFLLMVHWRKFATVFSVVLFAVLFWRVVPYSEPAGAGLFAHVSVPAMQGMDWGSLQQHAAVLRPGVPVVEPGEGMDWDDYRFAGTFFLYAPVDTDEASLRRAVVSYRPSQRQYIVSEGDRIGRAEVIRIRARELVLRVGDQDGVLSLGGEDGSSGAGGGMRRRDASQPPGGVAVGSTRFGEQTGAGSWRMDRDALLAYYEELLDNPERLLQVFDSMQPIYTADGAIEGYRLQTVGEAEFFDAVGFQEGDAVRAVNTLPMTNRRRAEFFIRQVVENDLSAIVIDLERDGTEQRLVYELR